MQPPKIHDPGRRDFIAASLGATAAGLLPLQVRAASEFPNKPLVLVCPYDAGGLTDAITRFFGNKLGAVLGQPVVVENRPGASGMIGTAHVARRPADGYTLVFGTQSTMAANLSLHKSVPYEPSKQFVGVHGLTEQSPAILVSAASPFKSIEELVAHAKKNPGKLNFGSPSAGTGNHLFSELFQSVAGVRFTHIPYRNSVFAMQALLAGDVDLIFDYAITAVPMIEGGRARPLVYTGKDRFRAFPGVRTVVEAGYPGAVATTWCGFFAPAGTPAPALKRLEEAITEILEKDAEAEDTATRKFGGKLMVGMRGAHMNKLVEHDIPYWRKLVTDAGISMH